MSAQFRLIDADGDEVLVGSFLEVLMYLWDDVA